MRGFEVGMRILPEKEVFVHISRHHVGQWYDVRLIDKVLPGLPHYRMGLRPELGPAEKRPAHNRRRSCGNEIQVVWILPETLLCPNETEPVVDDNKAGPLHASEPVCLFPNLPGQLVLMGQRTVFPEGELPRHALRNRT